MKLHATRHVRSAPPLLVQKILAVTKFCTHLSIMEVGIDVVDGVIRVLKITGAVVLQSDICSRKRASSSRVVLLILSRGTKNNLLVRLM